MTTLHHDSFPQQRPSLLHSFRGKLGRDRHKWEKRRHVHPVVLQKPLGLLALRPQRIRRGWTRTRNLVPPGHGRLPRVPFRIALHPSRRRGYAQRASQRIKPPPGPSPWALRGSAVPHISTRRSTSRTLVVVVVANITITILILELIHRKDVTKRRLRWKDSLLPMAPPGLLSRRSDRDSSRALGRVRGRRRQARRRRHLLRRRRRRRRLDARRQVLEPPLQLRDPRGLGVLALARRSRGLRGAGLLEAVASRL